MIKQLIEDLAYDQITLGQGLTRAKLIASKTQNPILKEWVNQELQGYGNDGDKLPKYRKIPCQTFMVIGLYFGQEDIVPIGVADPEKKMFYNELPVFEAVTQVESILKNYSDEVNITVQLPGALSMMLARPFADQIKERDGGLRSVRKQFTKAAYQNIIDVTKQTLLDILLELHEQFPNLENEFMATKENLSKVENTINNHIYGNNNPVNVAAGKDVVQKGILVNINSTDYSKLESLGVNKEEIEELKTIMVENQTDKPTMKEKAMKWALPIMTNITARGLYENAPQIMDFVVKLVE